MGIGEVEHGLPEDNIELLGLSVPQIQGEQLVVGNNPEEVVGFEERDGHVGGQSCAGIVMSEDESVTVQ